jgi:hypothetical protein
MEGEPRTQGEASATEDIREIRKLDKRLNRGRNAAVKRDQVPDLGRKTWRKRPRQRNLHAAAVNEAGVE